MSPRSFLTLLVVTIAVVVVAAVLIVTDSGGDTGSGVGGDLMFPRLAAEAADVGEVIVETTAYRIDLRNRDGNWVAADIGDYPIVPDAVAQIIAALSQMTIVDGKTDNPDWYRYVNVDDPTADLDPGVTPGTHITVNAGNGDVLADAIFGAAANSIGYARNGGSFVRRAGEARAWLVTGGVNIPGFEQDWFGQLFSIPGTNIAEIAIFLGEEMVLDAQKTNFDTGNYDLTYLSPDIGPTGATANNNGLRGLAQGIVSTSFESVRPADGVTFADDARTIRFMTRDGMQLDVRLGEADGDVWVTYAASAPDGSDAAAQAASINARSAGWAFKLLSYRITALTRDFTDLFDPPAAEEAAPTPTPLIPVLPGR